MEKTITDYMLSFVELVRGMMTLGFTQGKRMENFTVKFHPSSLHAIRHISEIALLKFLKLQNFLFKIVYIKLHKFISKYDNSKGYAYEGTKLQE